MTKYFTQFDETTQTVGANLAGWTTRGTAGPNGYAPAYGTPAVKRRFLNFLTNNSGVPLRNVVSWNSIDNDANRANVELVAGFSKDAVTGTDLILVARGVGATATAATEAYVARFEMAGNIYISKRSSATAIATIATTAFTFAAGHSYLARFRVNGSNLNLRVWDASLGMAGEPTTWNIATSDATFSSAGWVGLGGFDGGTGNLVAPWNFLAVATNGDTSVCPRTNTEYNAWLAGPNPHCILAEFTAGGYDPTGAPYTKQVNARISNFGFTSAAWDTPPSTHYAGVIKSIPSFSRVMGSGLTGPVNVSFGDLIVDNSRPASQPGAPASPTTMGVRFTPIGAYNRVLLGASTAIATTFTIEAWICVDKLPAGNVVIFQVTNGVSAFILFGITVNATLFISTPGGQVSSSNVISPNQPLHVAATGTGSVLALYINGVQVGSGAVTYTGQTQQGMISGSNGSGSDMFPGSIDEVRTWNVAETAAQILAYMRVRATGSESNLTGCWHLDEGIGTSTADASPTGNNGTLTSAALWSMTGMPKGNTSWGGERDDWLRTRWNRSPLSMWIGDPSWPRHDFRSFISGRIGQPIAPSMELLKFAITDMSDAFNVLLGAPIANGPYSPYLMGSMGGMLEPPKVDTANLKYQISNGAILAQTGGVQASAYDNLNPLFGVPAGLTVSTVTGGNLITANAAHGMVANYRVVFGASPPTGLTAGTNYWVIATGLTTTAFEVSASRGGAAVALTNTTGIGCTMVTYGYDFDEVNGIMTLAASNVGRVTVTGVKNNNLTAGYVDPLGPADVYNQLIFGTQGLALSKNNQDAANFAALDVANTSHSQGLGVWMDSQKHTFADALVELAKMSYTWFGFTADGLMQIGQMGLPATAVFSLTEDDVLAGSLKMVDAIRSIDFSKTTGFYAKWYTGGGTFPNPTPTSTGLGSSLAAYSYGTTATPLDNFPNVADSDTVTEFRSATSIVGISTTGATYLRSLIIALFQQRLGVFEFQTTVAILRQDVTIGSTISLAHSHFGFKVFSITDPASPDNVSATLDMTLLVVTGITVNLATGGATPVTIRGYRRLPGYFPLGDLT